MGSHKQILDVGASAHLGRAAQQHPHRACAHPPEQRLLLRLVLGLMDKRDLVGGCTF